MRTPLDARLFIGLSNSHFGNSIIRIVKDRSPFPWAARRELFCSAIKHAILMPTQNKKFSNNFKEVEKRFFLILRQKCLRICNIFPSLNFGRCFCFLPTPNHPQIDPKPLPSPPSRRFALVGVSPSLHQTNFSNIAPCGAKRSKIKAPGFFST